MSSADSCFNEGFVIICRTSNILSLFFHCYKVKSYLQCKFKWDDLYFWFLLTFLFLIIDSPNIQKMTILFFKELLEFLRHTTPIPSGIYQINSKKLPVKIPHIGFVFMLMYSVEKAWFIFLCTYLIFQIFLDLIDSIGSSNQSCF